jgi:hypothetical protein
MPPPLDLNAVPLLCPLVAALRLVCVVTNFRLDASLSFTALDAKIGCQIPRGTWRMAHRAA